MITLLGPTTYQSAFVVQYYRCMLYAMERLAPSSFTKATPLSYDYVPGMSDYIFHGGCVIATESYALARLPEVAELTCNSFLAALFQQIHTHQPNGRFFRRLIA